MRPSYGWRSIIVVLIYNYAAIMEPGNHDRKMDYTGVPVFLGKCNFQNIYEYLDHDCRFRK